ncbi:MAG: hypothetical protein PWP40_2566 [Rhodocyclaceae bacterium]|nr:hypothetical protein [Rhodocyclaceae bacterium]
MSPIFDTLPPDEAIELEQITRLIYEARENRRSVLAAVGASDEGELLARIAAGAIDAHPAYEHYLAARILADTHATARELVGSRLQEINRR